MGRKSPAKSNPRGVKVDTQTEKPLTKSGTGWRWRGRLAALQTGQARSLADATGRLAVVIPEAVQDPVWLVTGRDLDTACTFQLSHLSIINGLLGSWNSVVFG